MKRLTALAGFAVVAMVVVWWLQRDDGASVAAPAPTAVARSKRVASTVPPVALPRPAPEVVRHDVDEIVGQLQHAGRRCLEGRTPRAHAAGEPDESMDRVDTRVAIAFAGGKATVTSLAKLGDGFVDAALEQCVLDAMRAARWDTAHPDGTLGIEHTLYVGSLLGRDPLAPPPRTITPPRPALGIPRPSLPSPPR